MSQTVGLSSFHVRSKAINFQELSELAERELRLGMADARMLERALAEANGVEAHARQIYWQLRATALQNEETASVGALVVELDQRERRLRARKESHRWFWATACGVALVATAIFPSLAFRAAGKPGPWFFIYAVLSVAAFALSALAFVASRYHTHNE